MYKWFSVKFKNVTVNRNPNLHQDVFMSNALAKVVDFTTLTNLRTTRSVLMNFYLVNAARCQILIWDVTGILLVSATFYL